MTDPTLLNNEALLAHTAWVSALAQRLVTDPQRAEDVVQDAMALALERPPGRDRPVRAWLATVVRNLARREVRSSARRRSREARVARRGQEPSAFEVVERLASHRSVVEAVSALEEPYRTTLLLRFFDGMPPREIAQSLGIPVKTVKTRLTRGLERLRQRLSESHGGDDGAWLAALAPILSPELPLANGETLGLTATSTLGAIIVDTKLNLSIAALVVAGAVAGVWVMRDGAPSPEPLALLAADDADELEPSPVELASEPDPLTRRVRIPREAAEGPPASTSVAGLESSTVFMIGRVLDADAVPVSGIELELRAGASAEMLRDEHGVAIRTTATGEFTFAMPDTFGKLTAASEGWVTVLSGDVRPTSVIAPVVVVAPELRLAGVVVDTEGAPVAGAYLRLVQPAGFDARFPEALEGSSWAGWSERAGADGSYAFAQAPDLDGGKLRVSAEGYEQATIAVPRSSTDMLDVVLVRHRVQEGYLTGQVVDETGQAVEGARVAMGVFATLTDAHGLFGIDLEQAVATETLSAVKVGHLPAIAKEPETFVEGERGWPDFVRLELGGPPLTISGRVFDFDGKPRAGAQVWIKDATSFGFLAGKPVKLEHLLAGAPIPRGAGPSPEAFARVVREGGNWDEMKPQGEPSAVWSWVETDHDGRFRLPGLTNREYRLVALDPESLLMVETLPIDAGSQHVEIHLSRDALRQKVAGRVVGLSGTPLEGVRVSLVCVPFQDQVAIQAATFDTYRLRSGPAVFTDEDGEFEFEDVPRGGVWFMLRGDTILPNRHTPAEDDDFDHLEFVVEAKCHVEVILEDPDVADEVSFVDGAGEIANVYVIRGGSIEVTTGTPLADGKSGVIAISEAATRLILTKGEELVLEVPITPIPGEVVVIRPSL